MAEPFFDTYSSSEFFLKKNSSLWDEVFNQVYATLEKVQKLCFDFFPHYQNRMEVSVILTDDAEIQSLNKFYRHKDKPTNVLSFPLENLGKGKYLPPHPFFLAGDIIFSFETLKKEALEQQIPFENHLFHLYIHGFLHLLGFDHTSDQEAQEMEELEITLLEKANIKNPYQTEGTIE